MNPTISRRRVLELSAASGLAAATPATLGFATAAPMQADILINNAFVHTMNERREFYQNGAIAIAGGKVIGVGSADEMRESFTAEKVIDASRTLALPGFHNNHLHPALYGPRPPMPQPDIGPAQYPGPTGAFAADERGSFNHGGDYRPFMRPMVETARHGYNEEESYYYSLHTFMIEIAGGTTCYVDASTGHPRDISRAQLEIGIRGGVSRTMYDRLLDPSDFSKGLQQVKDADTLLAESEELYGELNGAGDGLVSFWFNLFTDVSSSDELLQGVAALVDKHSAGVTSHTAAIFNHDLYSRTYFGKSGLDRLENAGILGPNWLGAHMGAVTELDIPRLKAYECKIAHVPGTSMYGGKGFLTRTKIFPRLIAAGIPVSLGTDVSESGVAATEAQRAFAVHKDVWQDNRVIPTYTAFEMLTSNGAICGLQPDCGVIETNKKADIILIDLDNPRYLGLDPLMAFLVGGYPSDVKTSIINGEVVYENRAFQTVDADEIEKNVARLNKIRLERYGGGMP